jgi:hypothetical protein
MNNFFPWVNNTTIGERWPDKRDYANEPNPFQRDPQGRANPTAIAKAIKNDPAKARIQCRNAGEPVSAWFGENPL